MNSFEYDVLQQFPVSHTMVRTIRQIGEYRGKQELFKTQSPQVLETLRQVAVIQSTECSNRIEGVTAPLARIKDLIDHKTEPQNRSEQEIAGYRDVLSTIHTNASEMLFTKNLVLQLHRDLYQYLPGEGGHWKQVDNEITETGPGGGSVVRFTPVPAFKTDDAMERLHAGFSKLLHGQEIDPLFLIGTYVFDFLCIHPFRDGNGRLARLLTLLLLYQAGYDVGRFISLEQIVERTKDSYYDTLYRSSANWHEGKHSLLPWLEYFLGVVILGAFREFENRTGLVAGGRGTKTAMVIDAINRFSGDFSIGEIKERCPTVGIDMIRRVLRRERDEGKITCVGRGPQAKWKKNG
ncbi:MAG: Fic family protein [Desulfobacterales bacterium]|nr:Fic family protein [Desulfobacterales bacterium]